MVPTVMPSVCFQNLVFLPLGACAPISTCVVHDAFVGTLHTFKLDMTCTPVLTKSPSNSQPMSLSTQEYKCACMVMGILGQAGRQAMRLEVFI